MATNGSRVQDICSGGLMFSGYLQQNTKVGSSRNGEDREQVRMPDLPKAKSTAQ